MNSKKGQESRVPISFNKSEYRVLVHAVYQQLFMLESLVDHQNTKEFENLNSLSSKLIEYAPEFASGDLIARDVIENTIYPNSAFLDLVMQMINEYDEVSFWEELTHRLAERDLLRDYKGKELTKLSEEEYLELLSEKLVYYTKLFGENGLENVELKD
ncbi:MAG: hypothetical protein LAT52_01765 [Balneolales bacterium]|nr:hypothetical protein [Balneolales bacterium]